MTATVPHFPGKPSQVGAQPPAEPWAQSACPYSLSGAIARLGPAEEKLVVTAGAQPQAERAIVPLPCIGPRCALFISTKLSNGQEIAGCSHMMQVLETNRTNMLLAKFLDAIAQPDEAPAAPVVPSVAPVAP